MIDVDKPALKQYIDEWAFKPTGAQLRVIGAIVADMAAPAPMARLVQGDVGCGKTAVAFAAIFAAARAGWQAALMAPTEVLARQHYENALNELEPRGIHCALLTGSVTGTRRREVLAGLADGGIQLARHARANLGRRGVCKAGFGSHRRTASIRRAPAH